MPGIIVSEDHNFSDMLGTQLCLVLEKQKSERATQWRAWSASASLPPTTLGCRMGVGQDWFRPVCSWAV